jgi:hypothetical protein
MRVLDESEYDFGENLKRHGGVIKLQEGEYEKLVEAFGEC